ncbi:hypothetical protein KP509_10G039300 [Ceratopteris richardii]|uniref:Uncharacterized protein n=1 Tax=Ceratopteris richardii TaxID=49495 RepID=A0A8T2U0Y9_CERRI|nr:hypothetical protein KP509_10G039300 [Ceratopteris richardii]
MFFHLIVDLSCSYSGHSFDSVLTLLVTWYGLQFVKILYIDRIYFHHIVLWFERFNTQEISEPSARTECNLLSIQGTTEPSSRTGSNLLSIQLHASVEHRKLLR